MDDRLDGEVGEERGLRRGAQEYRVLDSFERELTGGQDVSQEAAAADLLVCVGERLQHVHVADGAYHEDLERSHSGLEYCYAC
jgi:hypothetical protein